MQQSAVGMSTSRSPNLLYSDGFFCMRETIKNCPICRSSARLLATHPDADIYRCNQCTHAFSDPESMPEQEAYDSTYFYETHRRWFEHPNTRLFEQIAKVIPQGSSVLDVGCGRGDLLRYLHRRRHDLQLTGIDHSKNQSDHIRYIQGDFFKLAIGESFDFVVSLATIEHVPDCVAFARRLHQLTTPGGIVVVMTINESGLLYALARAGRGAGIRLAFNRLYSRHHLHHFTRQSLRRALESGGLRVSKQIMHNAPVKAMDLPVRNPAADAILRMGVWGIFLAGSMTARTYQQTAICSASADPSERI